VVCYQNTAFSIVEMRLVREGMGKQRPQEDFTFVQWRLAF